MSIGCTKPMNQSSDHLHGPKHSSRSSPCPVLHLYLQVFPFIHSPFKFTQAFTSLRTPKLYINYSFFPKLEKRNLLVKNCDDSVIFALPATWRVSVDFMDAVRRKEIPESDEDLYYSQYSKKHGLHTCASFPCPLGPTKATWRGPGGYCVQNGLMSPLRNPDLRKQKYSIMGCKQTRLNFAPDGDIIFIILDSKCPSILNSRCPSILDSLVFQGYKNILAWYRRS